MDQDRFRLGKICKYGHEDLDHPGFGLRYVNGGRCVECNRERNCIERVKDPEKARERDRKYRAENPEKARERSRKYRAENPEKARKQCRDAYAKNPEKARERGRVRYATDDQYMMRTRLRARLRRALPQCSETCKVVISEYGINYDAIIEHLGPCPGNHAEYHIDHIRPLESFDLTDPDQIREAFAPENHQWLTAEDNMSKGCKFEDILAPVT